MYVTNLGGHSGCTVILNESDNDGAFVRKISGTPEYNERLIAQAKKQESFRHSVVKTPAVLGSGFTPEGLFYFDMEYIHGITLAEYMKTIETGKIRGLVRDILSFVLQNGGGARDRVIEERVFQNKIAALKEKLSARGNRTIDEGISILENHSWSKFYKSPCHGDLTLENIIIKSDQLYFIDFLDSFCDSWIIDISTLLQDAQAMWAYRHQGETDINTIIRLIVFRDILMEEVRRAAVDETVEVYYALLLKLMRIYPYVKDAQTYDYLNRAVGSAIRIIGEVE